MSSETSRIVNYICVWHTAAYKDVSGGKDKVVI